jgi:hypothetical protein
LDYNYLLQLKQDGFEEHPVKNGSRLVKVNVKKLFSGDVSETERRQSAGNTTNIYILENEKHHPSLLCMRSGASRRNESPPSAKRTPKNLPNLTLTGFLLSGNI